MWVMGILEEMPGWVCKNARWQAWFWNGYQYMFYSKPVRKFETDFK